jgi:tryptophanyl-tRNA synthetase
MNQIKPESIENLFTLMKLVSSKNTADYFEEKYNNCTIRYGEMKKQLADDIIHFTAPFREKILDLSSNDAFLRKMVREGAQHARESASKTIREVREIIGFKPF